MWQIKMCEYDVNKDVLGLFVSLVLVRSIIHSIATLV